MDTAFEKQSYMDHKLIWSGSIGGEENAECIVPDSMPDLGIILDTDTTLTLRSKELASGRLNVQADIAVRILYQPQGENTLCSLAVNISSVLTAPATVEDDCIAQVDLRVRTADSKIVNSRKAAVHLELTGMGYCYHKERLELICGVADCDCAVETLPGRETGCLVSDVREKTFVLTDDLPLPAGMEEVDNILTQRIALQAEEMEFAGDKLVFHGRVCSFLLLQAEDSVVPCSYETTFSQIMELEAGNESAADVALSLTGAYFDLPDHSGGKIAMELHLLAQVMCRCKTELKYLADVYSNQCALRTDFSELMLCSSQRPIVLRHSFTAGAETARDVTEVLFAKGSIGQVNIAGDHVELSVHLRAVYRCGDGTFASASRRVQESIPFQGDEGESFTLSAAAVTAVLAAMSGGSLEIRVSVEIKLQAQKQTALRPVRNLEAEDAPLPDAPSLTLLRCKSDEDLWTLAKNHRSTRAAILEANGGRTEGLLLIPKCR